MEMPLCVPTTFRFTFGYAAVTRNCSNPLFMANTEKLAAKGIFPADAKPAEGKKHVRLLLNVSGPEQQGYADFAWVRFIRQEDVPRLRAHPWLQSVREAE